MGSYPHPDKIGIILYGEGSVMKSDPGGPEFPGLFEV
jgi:hypothetical protein